MWLRNIRWHLVWITTSLRTVYVVSSVEKPNESPVGSWNGMTAEDFLADSNCRTRSSKEVITIRVTVLLLRKHASHVEAPTTHRFERVFRVDSFIVEVETSLEVVDEYLVEHIEEPWGEGGTTTDYDG